MKFDEMNVEQLEARQAELAGMPTDDASTEELEARAMRSKRSATNCRSAQTPPPKLRRNGRRLPKATTLLPKHSRWRTRKWKIVLLLTARNTGLRS